MSSIIRVPVSARLELQPDGQFKMVTAEYADVPASAVAMLLYHAYAEDKRCGNVPIAEHSKEAH